MNFDFTTTFHCTWPSFCLVDVFGGISKIAKVFRHFKRVQRFKLQTKLKRFLYCALCFLDLFVGRTRMKRGPRVLHRTYRLYVWNLKFLRRVQVKGSQKSTWMIFSCLKEALTGIIQI